MELKITSTLKTDNFTVVQVITACLSQYSYIVYSEGEATIIDPMRNYQPYLDFLKENKLTLKFIMQTHIHADFTSSHFDLKKYTTGPIYIGNLAQSYPNLQPTKDNQIIRLGKAEIQVLHTPGHTLESCTYQLGNNLFTGDTLFLGDVGRVDLSQVDSSNDLAEKMYDSIQRLKQLNDECLVFPGHGAGSACGGQIQSGDSDSLGNQKKNNKFLNMPRDQFITELQKGPGKAPAYFSRIVKQNIHGYTDLSEILEKCKIELSYEDLNGTFIFDFRKPPITFFIKGATFMNPGMSVAYLADLCDENSQVTVITQPGMESEMIQRLTRIGIQNIKGYFTQIDKIPQSDKVPINAISAEEFVQKNGAISYDVRQPGEFNKSHLERAINLPLNELMNLQGQIQRNEPVYLYCGTGGRSMVALSYLTSRFGFFNLVNIDKGLQALKGVNYVGIVENYCSSSQ